MDEAEKQKLTEAFNELSAASGKVYRLMAEWAKRNNDTVVLGEVGEVYERIEGLVSGLQDDGIIDEEVG